MNHALSQTKLNQQLDFQIKAAVRVAHLTMNEQDSSDENLVMFVKASRQVEDDKDVRQAMALAVCAASKNRQPL